LVAGALVLLVSILIGEKLGDRVLLQTERRVPVGTALVTPVPQTAPSNPGPLRNWKRDQVVSVATDPAFPDPRVTRPPTPTPRPIARRKPRTPNPTFPAVLPPETGGYTSPPLPLPLVSHVPGEQETEPPTLTPQERANVTEGIPATSGPR
jgi:hypothetical protein